MTRTFIYNFTPPSLAPSPGATIALDVSDIEDAGIREVLQTPGAAYGAWSILDALLARLQIRPKNSREAPIIPSAKTGDAGSEVPSFFQLFMVKKYTVSSSLSRDGIMKFLMEQVPPYRPLYPQIGALLLNRGR